MDDQNYNYMITFAKKWRHWGGGSGEDILMEFGLSQSECFRQLQTLLEQGIGAAADLPEGLREELTIICQQRLGRRHVSRAHRTPLTQRAT
ncbi:hypothetical protein [Rhodococcus globerulus]|uniref:DUF3263 domain-containing protein n=1 Tax=Rhodococcus globerulus TaxID=33008 RepID=A0ABU4C3Y0_RHOGO|nr:hypothetical protein [Rhodococcus globerulus]MDV6271213.1 hypothetical protein [Rhodococcus globerulus]